MQAINLRLIRRSPVADMAAKGVAAQSKVSICECQVLRFPMISSPRPASSTVFFDPIEKIVRTSVRWNRSKTERTSGWTFGDSINRPFRQES